MLYNTINRTDVIIPLAIMRRNQLCTHPYNRGVLIGRPYGGRVTKRPFLRLSLVCWVMVLLVGIFPAYAQDGEQAPTWDGQTPFTVLILGMDRRPNARDTLSVRTDVVILARIDPVEKRIGLLHIPRDLHFTPPGSEDFFRVNTLMLEGEMRQKGYGPYYVMDTLQYNFGMYIDRYVLFDFQAFIAVIDALGGIEITTTYTINDPTYPDMNNGYDPFVLPAGTHLLDGETALKYARTRHSDNDFIRGQRQMDVILAVHHKVTEDNILPTLLLRAPQLFEGLQGNVYTDLTLGDITMLALSAADVDGEDIHTASIDQDYNLLYRLPDGNNGYIADRSKLVELLTAVFGEHYAP